MVTDIFRLVRRTLNWRFSRPIFLIVAPAFTHRSAGIRALYRLCHHLNRAGYPSAMLPTRRKILLTDLPPWNVKFHLGPIGDAVVIQPEIVAGNPFNASKLVRWVLNDPGLLGGEKGFGKEEVVFVYDPAKLPIVNAVLPEPIGMERVLWVGVVDPSIIYPDENTAKIMDCYYVGKGHALQAAFPMADRQNLYKLEELTATARDLGDVLRKTHTLYSYDHYSNVLREAVFCDCEVRTMDASGQWHDPRHCSCPLNIRWQPDLADTYATQFRDHRVVEPFIAALPAEWGLPTGRQARYTSEEHSHQSR